MKSWFTRYLFLNVPEDSEGYRKVVTSNFILLCTLVVLLFFTISNYAYGNASLYRGTLVLLIIYTTTLLLFQHEKELLIHIILCVLGIGILGLIYFNKGQQYVPNWSLVYCYILMVMYGYKKGAVLAVAYMSLVLMILLSGVGDTIDTITFIRFTSVALIMLFLCYITELLIDKTLNRLAKTQATLEKLSITDGLTQIYNRRYFDKMFKQELSTREAHELKLVLSMIDIDYFKLYNDQYGHQAGDLVLNEIAEVLKQNLNRVDGFAFRIGGEEFAVLFYASNNLEALTLIETIQSQIRSLKIEHAKSPISSYLTLSAGLVLIPSQVYVSEESAYKQCDALLYKAKANGRNQIAY
ncbi:GGDEF domain-containing protein [Psychromonas sp.]|nr:GGDEF domain-containing protein [Psychromonas sp.]